MHLLRRRSFHLGIALLSAVPGLAFAADAGGPDARLAAAFGNTVTTTYPDGRTQKIWLRPDGTWTGLSRSRQPLAGSWTSKGDKVCLRQKKPPTLPFSYCTAFPADARVGAAWTSKDFVGTSIKLRLDPGAGSAN